MAKKVCVVGAGNWGRNHIRTLHGLGCLAGIVEPKRDVLASLQAAYPSAKTFSHLDGVIDQDFDGFTVATPAQTHYELAETILKRKKPVLVEKPIALRSSEARTLTALACDQQVNLMVGHVLLFHPAIVKMRALMDEGKIGKLQYLYSNRLHLGTVRTEENILWSFAPHDISIFQYFIGRFPDEVVSRGGAFVQPHIHDSTMTVLTYPGNIVGHIHVSWLHPFKEHRLVVIGSKGMLVFEDSSDEKEIRFYEKGINWIRGEPIKHEGPSEVIPYCSAMPLTEELRYFVDHLDGTPIERADGQSAAVVLEILEQATESLLSGPSSGPAASRRGRARSSGAMRPTGDVGRSPNGKGIDCGADVFVHPSSEVDEEVSIGAGTRIWHFSHVQSGARIGRDVTVGQNVNIGWNVKVGNFVKIQNNVSVYEGVELEDHVFCGPSMVFTNIKDPRSKYPQRGGESCQKTLVKEGASIGANATILCGIVIGRHAFIGAGAVVTRDVPDYALMVGVPARFQGWMCECGERLPGFDHRAVCPRCHLCYELQRDRLESSS